MDNGSTVRVTPEPGTEMLFRVSVSSQRQVSPRRLRTCTPTLTSHSRSASLEERVQVRTLDGRTIWVKIPAYSQNGQNIRLRGQGMPRLGSPDTKGDLYVTVRPQMPKSLTDEQRELVVKLQELRSEEE